MSLLNIKIFGYEIDDALLFKLILGFVCIIILLIATGINNFSDWVLKSLVIWSGVTMIIIPLTYAFLNEEFTGKYILMIASGIAIIVLFGYYFKISAPDLFINVIQSLIWMSMFSIILDGFKKRLQ